MVWNVHSLTPVVPGQLGCEGFHPSVLCGAEEEGMPTLPILIPEYLEVQPKLWALYAFGQDLNILSADEVTRALEKTLCGKA